MPGMGYGTKKGGKKGGASGPRGGASIPKHQVAMKR